MKARYTYLQPTPDDDGRNIFDSDEDRTPEFYVIVIHGCVVVEDEATTEHILEAIWWANNLDSRPRGQDIRSMCIGDIVIVGAEIYRAMRGGIDGGFEKLDEPVTLLAGRTLVRGEVVEASSTPMEDHYYAFVSPTTIRR